MPKPQRRGKILAIDFGLRRVGVAVSDPLGLLAHAREPLRYKSKKSLLQQLRVMVQHEEIAEIVIGLPLHMNGSEGEMAAHVHGLKSQLEEKLALPVTLWDERFTSVQAERLLTERGVRFSRNKGRIDRLAAVFILQSYLDYLTARKTSQNHTSKEQIPEDLTKKNWQ
jgi:putative Holliday junction resolvase